VLALEAAQHGIDEPRGLVEAERAGRTDRLRHGGVRRGLARHQLVETDLEQCAQARVELLGRARGERVQHRG